MSDSVRQTIDEVAAAIGGPTDVPHQPEGGSDVTPLTGHHLTKPAAEPGVTVPGAQRGAGSASLTPAPGEPADGRVRKGFLGSSYREGSLTAAQPPLRGVASLTAGVVNTPSDGGTPVPVAGEQAGSLRDPRLGPSQDGQQPGHPALRVPRP
jgi:hypothetical protein